MSECFPPEQPLLTPPLIIQQLLRKQAIPLRTRAEGPELPAAQRVQAVLFEDSAGTLLVLYPRNQLLDLKQLAELSGRTLNVVAPERLRRVLTQHGLSSLPGLPAITRSPCLYDERLLQQPALLIDCGMPNVLLDLSPEHFQLLLSHAKPGRLGQPLSDIHLNLTRPADDGLEIGQAVRNFTVRRIQQRLGETLEIPPLAQTARRIIKLRSDPEASVDDITCVVETDPALAAQVIRWAASPLYATSDYKIRSVEDAIVRVLGFDRVINLALSLVLGRHLNQLSTPREQLTPYWQQAIYTAALIEGLTRLMLPAQRPEAGLAYLCGLLHNFGHLLLAHIFPPHFEMIRQHQDANPHLAHGHVEQHLLGITREQIGSWMMQDWSMPDEIVTAVRFQHDPGYAGPHSAYPNLVFLAINLLRGRGIGCSPQQPIPEELWQRLGLEYSQVELALDKVLKAEAALRELASNLSQAR